MCQINKMTRNQCQSCRFNECLNIGINPNNVMNKLQQGGIQKENLHVYDPMNILKVNYYECK